ncbi:MAG: hypothetical protein M0P99_08365 [Candidatus Cloacimonetes bacterium]|nr:hypothetical protein [Candidatus Cloacimonadota bacterium]
MKKMTLIVLALLSLIFISGCEKRDNNDDNDDNDDKNVELLEDPIFATGFNLLGISPVEDGRTIKKHLDYGSTALPSSRPIWYMAQWWTPYDVVDATYKEVNNVHIYETPSRILKMNPEDNGYLYMELFGSKEYENGPRELNEPWTHALIEQNFSESVGMSELSSLILKMEVTIHHVNNLMGSDYDPGKHAAQLLWYITLRNVVPEGSEDVGQNGDFLWFGIPIYDNRNDFIPHSAHIDQGAAGTTGKLIYSMSSKYYFDEKIQMNKTYNIEIDVLPYLKEAFIYAINNNALVGARFENMQIGYMNFGWEVPGTFDVASTIRGISIKAIRK